MKKYILVSALIFNLFTPFMLDAKAAATPKFSVVALTKPPQQILANQIVSAQYNVTNNTKITRTFTLIPVAGITQQPGANICPIPFTLAQGQSCRFNLQLNAAQLGAGVHSGPVICKTKSANDNTPDSLLCSNPSNSDSLNVTVIPCTSSTCLNSQKAQQLRAVTARYEQQYHIPGLLAGIWIPGQGELIIQDGVADIETGRPITITDHVRIASITKSFTTTVVLQLVQDGLVNINNPISSLGFSIQNNNATIGQLADMRSGIFNYSVDANFLQGLDSNVLRKWQPQELVNFANSNNVYFAPGANWHYSNTNTILLGMIIEQLTGHFIGDEINNRIITPLGLTETSYSTSPTLPAPFSRGYIGGSLEDITDVDPSFSGAAGGMISTVGDLKKWAHALATGSVLSPAMQAQRVSSILPMSFDPCADNDPSRPHPTCPEYDQYGYGLGSIEGWRGHTGDYLGYQLLMMYEPTSGATIVIMVNISGVGIHVPTNLFREYLTVLNS
ncbi:MAG: serine hydrolase domain-containing protein [Gammaproteobacteria bacterium]